MKKLSNIVLICFLIIKLTAQEVQIPFDNEGKIESIDSKLNKKIGYFNDYKGFNEALLFQVTDSSYLLEITYQPENKIIRKRQVLNKAELELLKTRINESLTAKAPTYSLDQSGRTTFIVSSSALGLFLYAPSTVSLFNFNNMRADIATYMFTASASFALPFYLTRKTPFPASAGWLGIYGQTAGIGHGLAISSYFDMSGRYSMGLALLTSAAEGTAGYFYARNFNRTAGQANAIWIYGYLGTAIGFLTAGTAGYFEDAGDNLNKKIATTFLLSNAASFALGHYMGNKINYETGDPCIFFTTGSLGAITAITVFNYFEPKNYKAYTASAVLGTIAGTYLGNYFVKNTDYSLGEGILTTLGTMAGAGLGIGIGIIAVKDYDAKLLLTTATLGGWGSFYLLKSIFDANNNKTALDKINLKMNLGMLPVHEYKSINKPGWNSKFVPALNLSMRF